MQDGKENEIYNDTSISNFIFSPDGKGFAFTAQEG